MQDANEVQVGKNYDVEVPHACQSFLLKGSNAYDWGMKNRLARMEARNEYA